MPRVKELWRTDLTEEEKRKAEETLKQWLSKSSGGDAYVRT